MIKNHIRIFAFISFLSIASLAQAEIKYIFIDPKALFPTDQTLARMYISTANAAAYVLQKLKKPDQKTFFSDLKKIIKGSSILKTYDENIPMPSILCDWQLSLKPNKEIKADILSAIKSSAMLSCEKVFCSELIEMMFSPTKLISTKYVNQDLFDIIKSLSKQNVTIILAGNYDSESLIELQKKFSYVFDCIDHVIVSGDIKELKPSEGFYQHVLDTCNAEPKECISFEAEQKFIEQAKTLGLHVIAQNDKTDKKYFKQQLKAKGIEVTV